MTNQLRTAERILKALANSRRLMIIRHLRNTQGSSVGNIADSIKLSFKATSKHLTILTAVDITEKKQVSTVMQYSLQSPMHPVVKTTLASL